MEKPDIWWNSIQLFFLSLYQINRKMRVESVNNEIKLTFSKNALDITEIQSFIDYIKFREISALSKATQEDANKLAEEINQSWWDKNKHKFE